jgi:choline transporter-like protein 2/4/5
MIVCGYSQLKTAIDVIDAAADFLAKTKRIVLVPITFFVVTMIVLAIWLGAVMCVMSMGEVTAKNNQQKDISYGNDEKLQKKVFYLLCFMFFGLLWIVNFLKAQSSFITMVSACTYYFDSNAEKDGSADVGLGIKFAFMFHAGSIAMGSFIIALIQFIRITFAILAEQAQNASGDNAAVKIMIKVGECCLKCIEKIVDYINTMAYGYIAVSGDSFCSSAWNGFLLNMKFGLEFAWANFIASTFILLGKVGITVLNCFSCYMIMKHITHDLDEITSTAAPLAIVALVTFAATNIFLSLFDEAVLAMLVCLCVDKELNDGVALKGPPTFHDAFEKGEGANTKKVGDEYQATNNEMA